MKAEELFFDNFIDSNCEIFEKCLIFPQISILLENEPHIDTLLYETSNFI